MSFSTRRLTGSIIELVWSGQESPLDIERANRAIAALTHGADFDLLVDMRTVIAWSQETKAAVVEHQKYLLSLGMRRASVVVGSAVTRMQLNNVKKQSSNDRETQWATYDEALAFLKAPTVLGTPRSAVGR